MDVSDLKHADIHQRLRLLMKEARMLWDIRAGSFSWEGDSYAFAAFSFSSSFSFSGIGRIRFMMMPARVDVAMPGSA